MDHAHPMIAKTARGQGSMDVGLIANEEQGLDPWVSGQGAPRALNHDPAAMVAAHDIHCNSHRDAQIAGTSWLRVSEGD